jgi:hypothetical protein
LRILLLDDGRESSPIEPVEDAPGSCVKVKGVAFLLTFPAA